MNTNVYLLLEDGECYLYSPASELGAPDLVPKGVHLLPVLGGAALAVVGMRIIGQDDGQHRQQSGNTEHD